jgi:alpha-maltose-1-phosphate synthase
VVGMRVHFVNENIGGHATMHAHIRSALAADPDVTATFFDVPPRGGVERAVGARIPGLGRLDLDFQTTRAQLARSAIARRHLSALDVKPDALHLYTHNVALLSSGHMRRTPSVVSLDATNRQNAYRIPGRSPTRFTPVSLASVVPFERRVYESARRVVVHSNWAADSVLSYGVDTGKVEVIPFGITVPPVIPRERDGDRPRIVFVGTSMARKGGWRLVELWQRALAESSRLTLVTMERVEPRPGLEVVNDVRPGDGRIETVLAGSDIFAFPGEIDSFGYAILEAMAAGLPVVAARQGAVGELVDDGVTGLLVPPGDDEAFAAALRELVDEPQRAAELGAAGRARVLERFDARTTTASLIDVIRDAAG